MMIHFKNKHFNIGKKYRKNEDYVVSLKSIKIDENFKKYLPKPSKMARKYNYFKKFRVFNSPIITDSNLVLVDGYTSYLLAKMVNRKKVVIKIK